MRLRTQRLGASYACIPEDKNIPPITMVVIDYDVLLRGAVVGGNAHMAAKIIDEMGGGDFSALLKDFPARRKGGRVFGYQSSWRCSAKFQLGCVNSFPPQNFP